MSLKKLWRDYSLSIVLGLLFLGSWILHGIFQWGYFVNEAESHSQPIEISQYWIEFLTATFENWQSEFLQLLTMVTLTSFLIHKGSAESKDSNDKMQQSLDRIERQLNQLDSRSPVKRVA